MNDLRSQLAPGWSGVNIAIVVALFVFIGWPLGLLMIAYVVWGGQLGLDLSRPETLKGFGGRLKHAWQAATRSWGFGSSLSSGTPDPSVRGTGARDEGEALRVERETLERERREFEREKRDWLGGEGRGRASDGSSTRGPTDRGPTDRGPLDS